jgi:4'-phosphopantetheinyl transferase
MNNSHLMIVFLRETNPLTGIPLPHNHIHVWSTILNAAAYEIAYLKQVLSVDELKRAEKYYFDKDRDHFIVARGLLRHLLGRYLQIPPIQIEFVYNKYGKPSLGNPLFNDSLTFNLSHSNGRILYAISRNNPVGIDLEYHRRDFPVDDIAGRFFSSPELEVLRSSTSSSKTALFYQLWTRKEAYSKGLGKGLSIPFDKFDVTQAPGIPVIELMNNELPLSTTPWYLKDIIISTDYAAAIAINGKNWHISYPGPAIHPEVKRNSSLYQL